MLALEDAKAKKKGTKQTSFLFIFEKKLQIEIDQIEYFHFQTPFLANKMNLLSLQSHSKLTVMTLQCNIIKLRKPCFTLKEMKEVE